jgi:calcineurin-like phosphoesterase family protein
MNSLQHLNHKKYHSNIQDIFFTSDLHWFHDNIIKEDYDNRPFDNMDHMIQTMIENWNNVVKPNDIVFNLGDFILSKSGKIPKVHEYLSQLNGHQILVKGNHDSSKTLTPIQHYFDFIHDSYSLK